MLQTAAAGHRTMWLLADVPPGGSVDVSLATTAGDAEAESFASVGRVGPTAGLQRVELSVASLLGGRAAEGAAPRAVRLRFSALSEQTLYSFGFE